MATTRKDKHLLNYVETWNYYHKTIGVEIKKWNYSTGHPEYDKVMWNYYLTVCEKDYPVVFPKLWLKELRPNKTIRYSFCRYEELPFYLHGGITYYNKIGQVKGFRAITVGCDYNHLFDIESGLTQTLDSVYEDSFNSAKAAFKYLEATKKCNE